MGDDLFAHVKVIKESKFKLDFDKVAGEKKADWKLLRPLDSRQRGIASDRQTYLESNSTNVPPPHLGKCSSTSDLYLPSISSKETHQLVAISKQTAGEGLEEQEYKHGEAHETTSLSKKERLERELELAISAFEDVYHSEAMLMSETVRRMSLHASIEKRLRHEENKFDQAKVQLRAKLEKSNTQLMRALLHSLRALRHKVEQLEAREQQRCNLEQILSNELFYMADQICLAASSTESSMPLLETDLDDPNTALNPPLKALKSAIHQFVALHSMQYNPEREISALKKMLHSRKQELDKSKEEIRSMDNTIRELKDQVALSRLQRAKALEEATTNAYIRANEKSSAEIKRLKLEKDALTLEIAQLKRQLQQVR